MAKVRQSLGDIPMVDDEIRKAAGESDGENAAAGASGQPASVSSASTRLVTADGTYATQSIFSTTVAAAKKEERPPLRKSVDFFLDIHIKHYS